MRASGEASVPVASGAAKSRDGGRQAGGIDATHAEPHGRLADRGIGLLMLRKSDEHAVLAEDSRLFGGDLADSVAEVFGVVDADVGDDADDGLDGVGRVEPPAKPNLQHRQLNLLLGEPDEGDGCEKLEEAGVVRQSAKVEEARGCCVDKAVDATKVCVGDLVQRLIRCGSVRGDFYALVHAQQMRATCRGPS